MTQESTPVAGYAVTIPGKLADYQLTIPGRLPGLNEYTTACRTNPQKGNKMKQDAQTTIMWLIRAQLQRRRIESRFFCFSHSTSRTGGGIVTT